MTSDRSYHNTSQLAHGLFIAAAIGVPAAVLLVVGLGPMVRAFGVVNQAAGDGWDPQDDALIAEWETWAYTPQNFILAAAGGLLAILGWYILWRRRRRASMPGTGEASQRRWIRFRVRTLLLAVLLIGIPLSWVSYQLNWIRQRHELIAKHQANMDEFQGLEPEHGDLRAKVACVFPETVADRPRSPRFLWLFGEPYIYTLELVHFCDPTAAETQPGDEELARQLFPEAAVFTAWLMKEPQ